MFGVDNAEEGNTHGHAAGPPAPGEDGALEPVAVGEFLAEVEGDEPDNGDTYDDEGEEGPGVFNDDTELDGGDTEGDQKVGEEAAEALGGLDVDVVGDADVLEDFVDGEAEDEGGAEDGDFEYGIEGLDGLTDDIAEEGDHDDDGDVEGEGLDGDGGGGGFADGVALVRGDESAAHFFGEVLEVGDEGGVAFLGCPFDHEESADDGADNADGGGGHAEADGVFPSVFLEGGANSSCCAMSAVEACGEHDGEGVIEFGPDEAEDEVAEEADEGPLE